MISSFKSFLIEEEKKVFFTFGRMNPPTAGHQMLLDTLSESAGSNPYKIFLTQSHDPQKNPLQYRDKVKFARKMFPQHARSIIQNEDIRTFMGALTSLHEDGYKVVTMIVGSDRVTEFKAVAEKYNGVEARHGFYDFSRIHVESCGQRDPDSENVEGISASKQRDAALNENFMKFGQGLPKSVSNADARSLFNAVRVGMGLNESKNFKKFINLNNESVLREKYLQGRLFSEGSSVVIKETDEIATVTSLGTNYIIVEASNGDRLRKWLSDVEPLHEDNHNGIQT